MLVLELLIADCMVVILRLRFGVECCGVGLVYCFLLCDWCFYCLTVLVFACLLIMLDVVVLGCDILLLHFRFF